MNILQTCGSASWGGLEMQTLKISHKLAKKGHDITLLCAANTPLEREARKLNLRTVPLLKNDLQIITAIHNIGKLLRSESFEVAHSHLSHDLWSLVPAMHLQKSKSRLVLTKRMASNVNKKDIFHRYLHSRLDKVLTISAYIRNNVIQTCPVKPERVYTLHNGLEIEKYNATNYQSSEVRKELGIKAESAVIGIVGRFTPKKGHREFFHAAKQIKDEAKTKVRFLIVGGASHGEAAYEEEMRELISKLSLREEVILTGFRQDVPRMMSAMDLLAFPSYAESFGNTLLEAMAMQLPLVASKSGAVPEIVIDDETGILVPPKDASQLAKGILSLVENSALRLKMGEAGRKRVEQVFTFDKFIESLERHYHE